MFPLDGDAIEGIEDAVIVGEAEGDGARIKGARETQSITGDGNRGA